jgi:hypothetical protein
MNNSFPTAVLVSLVTTFSYGSANRWRLRTLLVSHRERGPKTRAAVSSMGGTTERAVIRYRETRFRTTV